MLEWLQNTSGTLLNLFQDVGAPLFLLQGEAGPTQTGWYVIIGGMASGMAAVFAALMLEMRTRRERAEKLVDLAAEDSRKQTQVLSDLTIAVREQTATLRQVMEYQQRNRDIMESNARKLEEILRIVSTK